MKLRNKKTGKVGHLISSIGLDNYQIANDDYRLLAEYDSLSKLNEDWEDYKPVHESAIKAVRPELLDSIKYYDGYGSVEL